MDPLVTPTPKPPKGSRLHLRKVYWEAYYKRHEHHQLRARQATYQEAAQGGGQQLVSAGTENSNKFTLRP